MAVEKDQSAWLPEPPAPRPARRESAIEAALLKFDGADAPALEVPRRSWVSTHRSQLAVVASALLLVVVGIPAALIGLRNTPARDSSRSPTSHLVVHESQRFEPSQLPPRRTPPVAQLPPSTPRPLSAPPLPKYNGADLGVPTMNEPARQAAPPAIIQETAPDASMAAAAPPPPPA